MNLFHLRGYYVVNSSDDIIARKVLIDHRYYDYEVTYLHATNWFQTPLALQDSGTLHTTWRYSDLIAVLLLVNRTEQLD